MKFKSALLAASVAAAPFALANVAKAQPVTGPYVELGGGLNIQESTNVSSPNNVLGGKFLTKLGYGGFGGFGYGFGNGFRIEGGGDFLTNDIKKLDANGGSQYQFAGQGSVHTYGPMLNVIYDFDVGLPVYPFVGAGAGYQYVELNDFKNYNGSAKVGGDKGSFAYDVIGGLSYPIAAVPGLSVIAEYRFMQLTASRNYNLGLPYTAVTPAISTRVKFGPETNSMAMLGLRYQLFQPPPPPPPAPAPVAAPAPVPAKTYLVFFDWDKYKLTPRATQIIAQAASDSKTQSTTTIMVNGYTDTSGTAVYNQGLSVRRAKAVEAQLVTDGVPESEITAQGFGDTHLLVPTGPGVREPQNRRVEIVLQ